MQMHMNLVDLVKSCPKNIYYLLAKFGGWSWLLLAGFGHNACLTENNGVLYPTGPTQIRVDLWNPSSLHTSRQFGVRGAETFKISPKESGEVVLLRFLLLLIAWFVSCHFAAHHTLTALKCGNDFLVANKKFEISKFKIKFRRARTCELQGFLLELVNFCSRTCELQGFFRTCEKFWNFGKKQQTLQQFLANILRLESGAKECIV